MIEVKNLSKNFGSKNVLQDFSLTLKEGERIAFISPSGSGKTTLLRIISGLDKKYSGICKVGGKISYMFQENRLFPNSTVIENVLAVTSDRKKATEILSDVELSDAMELYPDDLSGGMKRRCALARAICAEYDILFLDEPFTGLDNELKKRVAEKVLKRIGNKTLILVTHSEEEAKLLHCKITYI